MFRGLSTAIITPFKNKELDLISYEKLLEYQVANGVNNIVVCGTTGEATTLTNEEQIKLIGETVKFCKNKNIKVVAGASSSNTAICIELAKRNKELGVDGVLISVPPYNKPTQEGIYQHYKLIASEVKLPIILYNVPGRTSRDMTNDTIARLSKLDYIVAVKDATGDLSRVADLRIKVPNDFSILSGEDATTVGFNAMGGHGVISVASNVAPFLCSEVQKKTFNNDYIGAVQIQDKLINLNKIMFCESNPIPVKYAMSLLGYGDGSLRLPLVEAEDENKNKIKSIMLELGLL